MSEKDVVLQSELLPGDALRKAEAAYPGAVAVVAAWRYKARLWVAGKQWEFDLRQNIPQLTVVGDTEGVDPLLRQLAFHRAAETILAVRIGHEEWSKDRTKKQAA